MKTLGSQRRETLKEANYTLVNKRHNAALLQNEDGGFELFYLNDHAAGWVIEIDGKGYEFASSTGAKE